MAQFFKRLFSRLFAPEIEKLENKLALASREQTVTDSRLEEYADENRRLKLELKEEIREGRIREDALTDRLLAALNVTRMPERKTLIDKSAEAESGDEAKKQLPPTAAENEALLSDAQKTVLRERARECVEYRLERIATDAEVETEYLHMLKEPVYWLTD